MKTINIRATLLCAFLLLAIPMATTTVAGATDLYDGPLTPIGFKIVNGKSTGNRNALNHARGYLIGIQIGAARKPHQFHDGVAA